MIGRDLLPRTFGPFLGRFGRLNEVQEASVGPILAGQSVVIAAPTASGKTEAALAPLVERHCPPGVDGLRIVYVVPTRALVNDLVRRIEGPLQTLRVSFAAKTGDIPAFKITERPAVLLTTPESLDSLLCRRPALFTTVTAVVLDEVHLVDGTYRGDQLQVLLRRLPAAQHVVLSATIGAPEALAQRYAGPEAVVIRVGESRPIELEIHERLEDVVAALRKSGRIKVLWFCNKRADVETVSQELRAFWPKDRIVTHHGSLARKDRTDTEAALRDWTWGICVATMTLEVGIDVGDVDAVVLQGPPNTVSAFLQRIGRGGRREASIAAFGLCLEEGDAASFEFLAEAATEGRIEVTEAEPDPSVAVQQILSLLYGSPRGLDRERLASLLAPLVGQATLALILDHLATQEYVVLARTRVQAGTKTMDMGEKGRLHSNIPSQKETVLRDARTGKAIGAAFLGASIGDTVIVGGKTRRVVGMSGTTVDLEAVSGAGGVASFKKRKSGGAFRWLLPDTLRGT